MKVHCSNEYDSLKTVVLVPPEYMAIKVPINDIQKNMQRKILIEMSPKDSIKCLLKSYKSTE